MELKTTELTGQQKLIFEAVAKMHEGKKLYEQGELEFLNLTGDRKGGKTIAHRTLRADSFNYETRTTDQLMDQAEAIVKQSGGISTTNLRAKLNVGVREIPRVTEDLVKQERIEYVDNGGNRKFWRIKGSKLVPARQTRKTKSGVRHKSTMKIDTPELETKVVSFLRSHTWISKYKLVDHLKLSWPVVSRLLKHLLKKKIIKAEWKNHNPAHKGAPKNFERRILYWEVV